MGVEEWTYWGSHPGPPGGHVIGDSIRPVLDAGLVDLVATDHRITGEVRSSPPSVTPRGTSVHIASDGEEAIITGDVMHHPCQMAHPDWASHFDTDRAMVAFTEEMTAAWRGGEVRDLHADMMRVTLRNVAHTLFGTDASRAATEVAAALEVVMKFLALEEGSFLRLLPRGLPTPGRVRAFAAPSSGSTASSST